MQSYFNFNLNKNKVIVKNVPINFTLAEYISKNNIYDNPQFYKINSTNLSDKNIPVIIGEISDERIRFYSIESTLYPIVKTFNKQVWTGCGIENSHPSHPINQCLAKNNFLSYDNNTINEIRVFLFEIYYNEFNLNKSNINNYLNYINNCEVNFVKLKSIALEIYSKGKELRKLTAKKLNQNQDLEDFFTNKNSLIKDEIELSYVSPDKKRFYEPSTFYNFFNLQETYPKSKIISSNIYLHNNLSKYETFLSLNNIKDLYSIEVSNSELFIGIYSYLSQVETQLKKYFPFINEIFDNIFSLPIKNITSLESSLNSNNSNIKNILAPFLIAIGAQVIIMSKTSKTRVPILMLYDGYDFKSELNSNILYKLVIPLHKTKKINKDDSIKYFIDAYSVSIIKKRKKRHIEDNNVFTGAFALQLDNNNLVNDIKIIYSGIIFNVIRIKDAEKFLIGKPLTKDNLTNLLDIIYNNILTKAFKGFEESVKEYCKELSVTFFQKFYMKNIFFSKTKQNK